MMRTTLLFLFIFGFICFTWELELAVAGGEEFCLACHSRGSDDSGRQMDPNVFDRSVHGGEVGCLECHPVAADGSHQEHTTVTPVDCRQCHEDMGRHGTPQASVRCWDCHGIHDILPASEIESTLHESQLASTCGACHPQQVTGSAAANLLSFRIKGHPKGDLIKRYSKERCLDCHQGKGAHGETVPITGADCYRCHGTDGGVDVVLGSIHGAGNNLWAGITDRLGDLLYWACLMGAFLFFTFGWMKQIYVWRRSVGHLRWDRPWARFSEMIHWVLSHKRFANGSKSGLWHCLIFWGIVLPMAIILITQAVLICFASISGAVSALLDVAGLALVVGVLLALMDRRKTRKLSSNNSDRTIGLLLLIGLIGLSGFAVEGVRLSVTNHGWHWHHPIGGLFSVMLPASAEAVKIIWRIHFLLVLIFMALMPFSLLRHLVTAPINIFFRKRQHPQSLGAINVDSGECFGLGSPQDLSLNGRLDADTCMKCGRCEEICPAFRTHKPLSPTNVMQTLSRRVIRKTGNDSGALLTADELWACTTCGACLQACPVAAEPMVHIVDARRAAVLNNGALPAEVVDMLRKLEVYGAPGGEGQALRKDWLVGTDPAGIAPLGEGDALLWVGCQGAFHPRAQETARALVNLAARAGKPLAILGFEESCCGDPARRLGQEALFQTIAKRNIEKMKAHHIQNIITLCPHCRNVLANEYPLWQGSFGVMTGVEWAVGQLSAGRLKVQRQLGGKGVFHDPCYLARGAKIHAVPHELVNRLWAGGLALPAENREKTFCCGAGGGAMWLHESGERVNCIRAEQLAQCDANAAVTACPFCITMLEDGLGTVQSQPMSVVDLLEALEWASR